MQNDLDMISFGIIANAGDAKQFAFDALQAARNDDKKKCDELLGKSHQAIDLARRAQTDLLFAEMNGDRKQVSVLLVHSQDHLMTASLAIELIEQMIITIDENRRLQEKVEKLESRFEER